MFVTELTSHREMSALNAEAERNIPSMFVTELTSHRDMSALKDPLLLNKSFMSVTSDTSQSAISTVPAAPQSAPWLQHATPVGSTARQLSTAVFSAVRSGNASHLVSTPSVGSSPGALYSPAPHATHHSDWTCSLMKQRPDATQAVGGPSVVADPSARDTRESQVSAPVNIPVVFDPDARVHPLMSWWKLEAPSNIPAAVVTCNISHWLMSTLNFDLPWNRKLMSVTCDTSQWGMVSSHSLSPTHASTTAFSSALVVTFRVHTASVNTRSVHDAAPVSTNPGLHVGTHDVPLTRVSVQSPTPPLRGGVDASHASSLRTHAAGGPFSEPLDDA